jgi:D-alanine-D-alanine ligase
MSASGPSVVVLAGGLSHERDVSLRSGRRVAEALRGSGLDVEVLDVDAGLLPALAQRRPGVVVPLLHGATGEDGSLRDVLELMALPYVGSRPQPSRTAFDKPAAKAVLAAEGVATPASVALPQSTFRELGATSVMAALVQTLGLPLMVKPAAGGSSLGATVVRDAQELPAAMVGCFAYGGTALVETFVPGSEVSVSVVETPDGPMTLPAVEIVPDGGFYDYAARYTAGTTEFFAPARLEPGVARRCADVALAAHAAMGLRDLSRTDLVVDADGACWFLETNVAPGMTETSLFPQAVVAAGHDFGTLWHGLVDRAAQRETSVRPG